MKRVAWFAVARSPYNDFLFASLSRAVDLTVVYTFKRMETHPWAFGDAEVRTLYADDEMRRCVALARNADAVVLSGWHDPRYVLLPSLVPSRTPKAFWTDTPRTADRLDPRGLARSLVARWTFRRFDQVWATGRPGCEALAALGCPRSKIRSLPFFYDLTRYDKLTDERRAQALAFRREHAPDGALVLMGAGQLAAKKRYGDAIQALARCASKDVVLWLCGVGPEQERLEQLARAAGVQDRVKFLGWLQPDRLELAFLGSDVFVHPASRDPFPTVVLEAMTWGRPVVGTSVSGSVVDRVVSGENGFVFAEGDVAAFADHVAFFARDREALGRFQRSARATACKYPVDLALERLEDLMGEA